MIFPGFPGVLSFFQVFQVEQEPWMEALFYTHKLHLVTWRLNFTHVCHSFCSWGCLPQCMLGYHPPGSRHSLRADTPQSRHHLPGADTPRADTPWSRHPPRSRPPGSRHPPRADPPEQTPPEQTPAPQSKHPPEADTPRSRHSPGAEHAGRYGQRADGTHLTGMQSCA